MYVQKSGGGELEKRKLLMPVITSSYAQTNIQGDRHYYY
jgi:hypothetical protein